MKAERSKNSFTEVDLSSSIKKLHPKGNDQWSVITFSIELDKNVINEEKQLGSENKNWF